MVSLAELLSILLVIIGLIGAILPLIPGTPFILAGVLLYNLGHGWDIRVVVLFTIQILLAALGATTDWWLAPLGARRAGASWLSLLLGFLAAIVGLILFSLPGAILAPIVVVVLIEYRRQRSLPQASRAGLGYFIGWVISSLAEVVLALIMVGLFAWQAFFP
ncbi:MAG: DUF456 domain-containing protein [Chloroflexi bacterium]|nr:DUF456 domain-containing protein [Chloroflexota bacterium]